jgi:hypothetical protein
VEAAENDGDGDETMHKMKVRAGQLIRFGMSSA